ncbi:MAG: chromosome partitioning protein ParA [Planctomycetota bacterium]|nr:MAG: chromosome partitioning protein ParA [Planctomycetota bacterium]
MARVIAVANQKGGVGKTTTAVNLGACLARAGQRTLLCDLAPQANLSCALGRGGAVPAALRALVDDDAPPPRPLATVVPGLELVPGSAALAELEPLLWRREDRCERLRKALAPLVPAYDVVLIDCPPSLGLLPLNALAAAGSVLLPVQCEFFAMEGLARLLEMVRAVKKRFNPQLAVAGIVLTFYDDRVALVREVAEEVRSFFGAQVLRTMVPRDIALVEAASHGLDILSYRPSARASWAYVELARELNDHERGDAQARAGPG